MTTAHHKKNLLLSGSQDITQIDISRKKAEQSSLELQTLIDTASPLHDIGKIGVPDYIL